MMHRPSTLGDGRENPRGQGEGIVLTIARPVMVCGIRKPQTVGYEMLPLGGMVKTTLILLAASSVLNFPLVTWLVGNQIARGDDTSLRIFSLVFLGLGLALRHQRKREKFDPNRRHRLDPGVSWFTFLPIREDYVYRFVDPGVAFVVGALLRSRLGCPLLGLYWMVAALALAAVEWELHQRTEQHDWQLGDGPKEAVRDAEVIKAMAAQTAKSSVETALPTGMDAKLAADIERRQRAREEEAAHDVG
jgi:hypothetical protein